ADAMIRALPDITPYAFVTPTLEADRFEEASDKLRRAVLKEADVFVDGQEALAYRALYRSPSHRFFGFMAWGSVHSTVRSRLPLLAFRLTQNPRYRRAVLLGADWELGCNGLGSSMITGLGSQYPTTLQHILSEHDDILEAVPGIPPFGLTYGISASSW